MNDKTMFYLGNLEGSHYYLQDFSYDCEWYWAGGYVEEYSRKVGNHVESAWQSHTHFNGYNYEWLLSLKNERLDEKARWILLDLMKQFYALQECAAVYQYGGHMCSDNVGVGHDYKPSDISVRINKDIETMIVPQVQAIFS